MIQSKSTGRNDRNLVSSTVGALTQHMRSHDLGPGDQLPSESDFSREHGVSRTVVREAFRSLAAMRMIELQPGKRATVARLDYGTMSPLIEHGVNTDQISIQQIYDVRRTIEMRTSALAALRRDDREAARIVDLAEAMKTNFHDAEKVMELDLAFHIEIAKASRNPVFGLIVGAFDGVTRQTWFIGWKSRDTDEERMNMVEIHIALAQAIAAGDPQSARDHMADHFDVSVRALLQAGIS